MICMISGHSFDILTFDFLLKPPQPTKGYFCDSEFKSFIARLTWVAVKGWHMKGFWSGMVNLNMVNSKFHLIQSFFARFVRVWRM